MILFLQAVGDQYKDRVSRHVSEEIVLLSGFDDLRAAEALAQAEIIVGFETLFTAERIRAAKRVRWFHALSAGVDQLPFDLIRERNIQISNSSGIHGPQMAENIFGMMLSFTRGLHVMVRNQQHALWDRHYPFAELPGSTLAIVGAGRVAQEAARKAKAFDMSVVGVRKTPRQMEYFDEVVGLERLHKVLATADFVLILTPLTPDTRHLIGARELSAMKRSAYLLSFGRGDVVDEPALIAALQSGEIAGAGLDVFHKEPLPADSPLWGMPNVIISPHTSGASPAYFLRAFDVFLANYRAYRAGEPLPNRIDPVRQY